MNNNENKKLIGIWGYPDPDMLDSTIKKYPEHEIIDLDVAINAPSSDILPDAYCRIIRNIVDNALFLKNDLSVIVASVGEEKCDAARFAAKILEKLGFNIIQTKFTNYNSDIKIKTPISTSGIPLKEKVLRIMDGVITPEKEVFQYVKPEFGFWGVPPNDLRLLELFPDNTHVFGWTRCVEAKRPADIELEMHVDETIPTVFFSQTFCAKMQLGKYLAKKYNGLYVDLDDVISNSVKAKIEAFIRLR